MSITRQTSRLRLCQITLICLLPYILDSLGELQYTLDFTLLIVPYYSRAKYSIVHHCSLWQSDQRWYRANLFPPVHCTLEYPAACALLQKVTMNLSFWICTTAKWSVAQSRRLRYGIWLDERAAIPTIVFYSALGRKVLWIGIPSCICTTAGRYSGCGPASWTYRVLLFVSSQP